MKYWKFYHYRYLVNHWIFGKPAATKFREEVNHYYYGIETTLLILLLTTIFYYLGLMIYKYRDIKRMILIIGLILTLGVLSYYKYTMLVLGAQHGIL